MTDPTIGSLCTGYGGLDLAVEQHYGARTVWVSDVDKNANLIIDQRFPGVPNLGDLTVLDWSHVPAVDILIGGYPCQPFSNAGNRKGTKDVRHIWPHIRDAVATLRPRVCVFENVQGHLSLGGVEVVESLAALGYSVRWGLVRASDAGAPHRRARVFIVAEDDAHSGGRQLEGVAVEGDGLCEPGEHCCEPAADASGERHGPEQDTGTVGRLDAADEGQARQRERSREAPGDRSATVAAHTDESGPQGRCGGGCECADQRTVGSHSVGFGPYEAAIRRWEHTINRPAPAPTVPTGRNGGHRLSPAFVEWMMGLPEGWVTGTGISHVAQLKALGNGVVPQQALLALQLLTTEEQAHVA